jgi:hypothetical protein
VKKKLDDKEKREKLEKRWMEQREEVKVDFPPRTLRPDSFLLLLRSLRPSARCL